VLSAEDDLEIVALAGDGASTLQAVSTHHPDVLVVDTEMPGPAVTELVRLVGQAEPGTRVLLLAEDTRPGPRTGRGHPCRRRRLPGRRGRPPGPPSSPPGVTPIPPGLTPTPPGVTPTPPCRGPRTGG
ncbi:MAG: hypothetical protein ABWZ62_01205, partial [Actinomycetota bacterium]